MKLEYFRVSKLPTLATSFSRIATHASCNRQALEKLLNLPEWKFVESKESKWGVYAHEELCRAVSSGYELPDALSYWRPMTSDIRWLVNQGWTVHAEYKRAWHHDTGRLHDPADFTAPIHRYDADLVLISPTGELVIQVDWKTGKPANPDYPNFGRVIEQGVLASRQLHAIDQIRFSIPGMVQEFPNAKYFTGIVAYLHYDKITQGSWSASEAPAVKQEVLEWKAGMQTTYGMFDPEGDTFKHKSGLCKNYCASVSCNHSGKFTGKVKL